MSAAASASGIGTVIVLVQYRFMRVWKILGLAGIVGVTVAGVAVGARKMQREHREYEEADVDELRSRLHARFAALDADPTTAG